MRLRYHHGPHAAELWHSSPPMLEMYSTTPKEFSKTAAPIGSDATARHSVAPTGLPEKPAAPQQEHRKLSERFCAETISVACRLTSTDSLSISTQTVRLYGQAIEAAEISLAGKPPPPESGFRAHYRVCRSCVYSFSATAMFLVCS